jgi:hypothetical protein
LKLLASGHSDSGIAFAESRRPRNFGSFLSIPMTMRGRGVNLAAREGEMEQWQQLK